jgi:hypothetical protein
MRAILILAPTLLLGACHSDRDDDRGPSVKRAYPVAGFDRIALAGPYDAVVTVGGALSVRAEGDSKSIDRLVVRVENGELKIETRHDNNWSWGFSGHHRRATIVYVTVPSLSAASIGGSGDMKIDKVGGKSFTAAIAGSGDMQIGSLQVGEANLTIAGSGDLSASGKAQKASFKVAGSGDIAAGGFESATATIAVAGSGDIAARVTQNADVSVMGSGDVTVTGGGKCAINKVGSGDVHCT